MADRLGLDFLRLLRAAEFFTDTAIFLGLDCVKTFFFKSIALLVFVTFADHFFFRATITESWLQARCQRFVIRLSALKPSHVAPTRGNDRPQYAPHTLRNSSQADRTSGVPSSRFAKSIGSPTLTLFGST